MSRTVGRVVELCGLPGGGKSHLARRVCDALEGQGAAVHRPGLRIGPQVRGPRRLAGKLGLVTRAVLDEPGASLRLAAALHGAPGTGGPDVLGRWVAWSCTQRLVTDARRLNGVTVLDEGVLQAIWSIGLRSDVAPVLRRLERDRASWAAPDLVVVVDASVDLVDQRLASRRSRHSRTQRLPPEERARELRHGAALLDRLADWWGSPAGPATPLLRVGDDHSTQRVVGMLAEHLGSAAGQQPV